jgi:hypothetical protein
MTPKQSYKSLLAQKVIEELKSRNIKAYYFKTKKEALKETLRRSNHPVLID